MKRIVITAFVLSSIFISCKKDNDTKENMVLKGTEVNVNHGKAYTWIETSPDNKPLKVGIYFNTEALNDGGPKILHDGEHGGASVFELDLPSNKEFTIFDHVTLDWNPRGHAPEGVYTSPHFDFHFYMISSEERKSIPSFETDPQGFNNYPGKEYLPLDYFPIPGGQEKMGVHWADAKSPELNPGGTFTQTFIYGSYNGKVNFYEPMATKQFFLNLADKLERPVPQPTKFAKAGYYPIEIAYHKVNGGYEVILSDFVFRNPS